MIYPSPVDLSEFFFWLGLIVIPAYMIYVCYVWYRWGRHTGKPCTMCKGTGVVERPYLLMDSTNTVMLPYVCPRCEGTGKGEMK